MPVNVAGAAREKNDFEIYFNQQLKTLAGTIVVRSMVATATLKITLASSPATIVNNRSAVDVADCFNENGEFRLRLTPNDAVILSSKDVCEEIHIATLTVVISGAEAQQIIEELRFKVSNLETVSSS